jgi:hypothetical protein
MVFDVPAFLTYLFVAVCLIMAAFAVRGIAVILNESKAIGAETLALLNAEPMPAEKRRQARLARRRVSGLRLKFASFILAIALVIVLMFSVPFFLVVSRTQRRTLMTGLFDRSVVLLDSLAWSAYLFLPSSDAVELARLPRHIAPVPEARYVTITSFGTGTGGTEGAADSGYVWASNDPDLLKKIDTPTFEAGVSRITDGITPALSEINARLNAAARESAGVLSERIGRLEREADRLLLSAGDAESRRRLADIRFTVRELENRITDILDTIGNEVHSYPAFDVDRMTLSEGTH